MHRKIWGILFIITILISMVGCKQKDNIPVEDEGKTVEFTASVYEDQSLQYFTESEINNGEPITINMWVNEDWLKGYQYFVKQYQKYRPNVTIKLTAYPWNTYWTKLQIALQNGTGPDIFHMHPVKLKQLEPYLHQLSEHVFGREVLNQSFEDEVLTSENGALYCVVLGRATGGIFYNEEIWEAAGLTKADIPETWEELRTLAITLTQRDSEGNIIVDGFNCNNTFETLLMTMQIQNGEGLISENGNINYNTIINMNSLEFIRTLYNEDNVSRINEADSAEMFAKGDVAMIYGWSWIANYMAQNNPNMEYFFSKPPVWENMQGNVYDYNNYELSFSINNSSDVAVQMVAEDMLLFYLCNNEVLTKIVQQAQIVPSKISLKDSDSLGKVISVQATYIDETEGCYLIRDDMTTYLERLPFEMVMEADFNVSTFLNNVEDELTRFMNEKTYVD